MRFNETCILIASTFQVDKRGAMQPVEVETEVFCNPQHVGANTWSSMYEIGISVDAKLQVRTADYDGQRDVRYRGKRHSVEVIDERGDFTVLTLRVQQSDKEGADYPAPTVEHVEGVALSA